MEPGFRQLILCPEQDTWQPPSPAQFVAGLHSLGLLGQPLEQDGGRFLIGDAFLQLFTFMGCAPSIEFTPPDPRQIDWQGFVFIHVGPVLAQPRWLVDSPSAKPACPNCQRRSRDWLQHYREDTGMLSCPHCQHAGRVCDWHWYDAGACARQFVSIVNVYPKESLPTETLLSQLQQDTGVAWRYFYLHAPLISH